MLKGGAMELTRDARDEIRGDSQVDERTAHAWTRRLYAEMAPQFSRGPRESEGRFYVPDSDCDFPPTVHPGRELFTASLLVSVREDTESAESFVIQGRPPDSFGEPPPMWTKENRARYDRSRLRYPSDLTDEEWALIEPHIPPAKRGGAKRTVKLREIVNGLMYILSAGCQWRAIPKDLPPRSTLYDYFDLWNWDGTLDR